LEMQPVAFLNRFIVFFVLGTCAAANFACCGESMQNTTDSLAGSGKRLGQSLADARLQGYVVKYIKAFEMASDAQCNQRRIVDTEVIEQPSQPGKDPWVERWTVDRCGSSVSYRVAFTPSNAGGTDIKVGQMGDAAVAPPLPAPPSVATFKVTPGPGPYNFDCDARPGYFSDMNALLPGNRVQVTGFIQVLSARKDAHWVATGIVGLAGANQLPKVGLVATVMPDSPKIVDLKIRGSGGPKDQSVVGSSPIAASIPFTLTLDDAGHLTVSAASAEASVPVEPFPVIRLNLSCSTAHIRFSNVTIVALN
jgi:hypothetical protein